jgi:predicted transglutaminase-like cysteine proteinase
LLFTLLLLISLQGWASSKPADSLFGYQQSMRSNLGLFPQWLSVLDRHVKQLAPAGRCSETRFNQCHLKQWLAFIASIKRLPEAEQVRRVNQYANEKPYVLDIENYGMEDYWATPQQFLDQSGDCEDYAIIKMLSLKHLGLDTARMRVVVVQDTNLRVAHAVLSLEVNRDIMILDNQIKQVISHKNIFHYVPVYSVSESNWWMHLPN